MEEQIVQAVDLAAGLTSLASETADLRAQAIVFLNQVQTVPQDVWAAGWNVFESSTPRHSAPARMFGLSLVTSYLATADSFDPPTAAATAFLQQALLAYVQQTYVLGPGEKDASLISKLAQMITHLLAQPYAQNVPSSLLPDLFALLRAAPSASSTAGITTLNAPVADLILKALHDLSLTLGSDVTIRAAKDRRTLLRDGQVKDAIRAHHATALAEQVWSISEECLERLTHPEAEAADGSLSTPCRLHADTNTASALLRQALVCVGDYSSWLDISLMVTPRTIELLMRALHLPSIAIRGAAADALFEVVQKGMKPSDKQQLLALLGLTAILAQQERTTRSASTHQQLVSLGLDSQYSRDAPPLADAESEANVSFRERIAKLADGIATELCKIIDDTGAVTGAVASTTEEVAFFGQTRQAAIEMLDSHLPLVLCFLVDDADGPSEQVLPSIHAVLGMYKKNKRRIGTDTRMQQHPVLSVQQSFLTNLMAVIGQKLKFGIDQPWTGLGSEEDTPEAASQDDDAPESDEAAFVQMRSKLQQVAAAVAGLDEELFSSSMQNVIVGALARYEESITSNGSVPLPSWQDIEVALYSTFIFGEILSTAASNSNLKAGLTSFAFLNTEGLPVLNANAKRGTQPKATGEQLRACPLNLLGQTVQRVLTSGVATFPHPAVQLQLFETLVRYSAFFHIRPALLQNALAVFLGVRGIHSSQPGFRKRANYLFARFVRETRSHLSPDMVAPILENMQDVLAVHAELPAVPKGEDPFAKGADGSAFDSQLHLFHVVSTLLASIHHEPERQSALLSLIVFPLAQGLTEAVQAFDASGRTDLRLVLQVHHNILALSTLVQGFPDATHQSTESPVALWIEAFKQILEHIMSSVATLRSFQIVREAGRGAFVRIINHIGQHALPFVPVSIETVLSELSPPELVDSLNLLSMLTSKYKQNVQSILEALLLDILERTFTFLNQPITGTDESLERTYLQKSYISLINSLVTNGLDSILLSPSTCMCISDLCHCLFRLPASDGSGRALFYI